MIARHSNEQSGDGEGVEVIENKECEDEVHGKGQYTEKHIHLSKYVVTTPAVMKCGKCVECLLLLNIFVLLQSSTVLATGHLSTSILRYRKVLELLSIHNHRLVREIDILDYRLF